MIKKIAANPFYELQVDVELNLIYLNLCGFWGARANVPEYLTDCQKAASCAQPGFRVLVDLTKIKTVSSDAAVLHTEAQKIFMQAGISLAAEVYLPQSTIARHQLSCIKQSTGVNKMVKVFTDLIEAKTWLIQADDPATQTGVWSSLKVRIKDFFCLSKLPS